MNAFGLSNQRISSHRLQGHTYSIKGGSPCQGSDLHLVHPNVWFTITNEEHDETTDPSTAFSDPRIIDMASLRQLLPEPTSLLWRLRSLGTHPFHLLESLNQRSNSSKDWSLRSTVQMDLDLVRQPLSCVIRPGLVVHSRQTCTDEAMLRAIRR